MSKALEVEISAFLKQYDEAFTTFDGDQIATLYCIAFSPVKRLRGSFRGSPIPIEPRAAKAAPCTIWRSFQ
jgi:hypothetical protein